VPQSYQAGVVTLCVSSPFAREWLEKKAANAIRSALEFHLDVSDLQVRFVVQSSDPAHGKQPKTNPLQTTLGLDDPEPDARPAAEGAPSPPRRASRSKRASDAKTPAPAPVPCMELNDRFLLDRFLTGDSNRLAHAGALAVSERPGESYNPLFVYGGPGIGKTHLLQGIAHHLKRTRPDLKVAYVDGEHFAQRYITALREHATEEFRRRYRQIDVWLVDDVQFIAGKEHTKEEFFHTFNSLWQNGKQIVIASDRSPRELTNLDERLRSRFQGGLIADITPPDLETRVAFLHECRAREKAAVEDDVLEYIADAIQSNMRALEGALTRLIAYSSIMRAPMSAHLAQEVLSEYFISKPIRTRRVTVPDIVEVVSEHFGTAPNAILGPSRIKDVVTARHVAMFICRETIRDMNTSLIGTAFGGRDHATIVYACQRVRTMMELDPELREWVTRTLKTLGA
jgi:chromosomal replication initiator protein